MAEKHCQRCETTQSVSEFHRDKKTADGLHTYCKTCNKARVKAWAEANPDKTRAWREKNRERLNIKRRDAWRAKNPGWGQRRQPTPEKACSWCDIVKPLEQFYNCKDAYDGRTPHCAECGRKAARESFRRDPEGSRQRARERYRQDPERHRSYTYNSRARHPEAIREQRKRQYAKNPDYYKRKSSEWYRENLEYARARDRARRRSVEGRECRRRWDAQNRDRARSYVLKYRALKRAASTVPFTAAQLRQRLSMFSGCWMCGGTADSIDHVKPLNKGGPHILSNLRPACISCNSSKSDRWPLEQSAAA